VAVLSRVEPLRGGFPIVVLVAASLLSPAEASADVSAEFTYSPDIVWSTTVRLLRVDLGCDIAEQDRDNGYLLFVVHENGRDYNGSLEIIFGAGERGIPTVQMSLRIQGLPSATEETILRKLRTKLREDYGLPPRAPAVAPPPEAPPQDEEAAPPEGGTPTNEETESTDDSP
jgi:hypothetical protein